MIKLLITLLVLIGIVTYTTAVHVHPFDVTESSAFQHFLTFVKNHNKKYDNVDHFLEKFKIFRNNLVRANELNEVHLASGKHTNTPFGITKFSDISQDEFVHRYLNKNLNQTRYAAGPVAKPDNAASVDWAAKGATTPVKDQGQCGSCWAFSATEAIESYAFLDGGYSLSHLSAQQITSCTYRYDGCEGGEPYEGYDGAKKDGGIMLDSDYPYTSGEAGTAGPCAYDSSKVSGIEIHSYRQTSGDLEKQLTHGPPSVCVAAEQWSLYQGGVMSAAACGTGVDHCVQATGVNYDNGTPYFIVRNSWNTDWGEKGYIYLEIDGDACEVQSQISYPTF